MSKPTRLVMLSSLVLLVSACSGGDDGPSGPDQPQPGDPTASFTVSPGSGDVVDTFTVDASASSDEEDDAALLEVRWDWENDGTYDTAYSTTKTADHQYLTGGTFTIRLEVRDSDDATATATRDVSVTRDVAAVTLSPPAATVDNGFTAQFTAAATDGNGNAFSASTSWSVEPAGLGSVDGSGLFTAGTSATSGWVIGTAGSVSDSAEVTVQAATISFATDLSSTFQGTCAQSGCHSGVTPTGGLNLESYSGLMAGGDHGAVVTPGDADGSIIIQKLSPSPPFGARMPASGSVTQAWRNQLYIWIQQGAADNAPGPGR
jgi:hypothetical protein